MGLHKLLQLRALTAGYGETMVLKNVNLDVNQGEIVALVGGNGAGKTTTLRAATALVRVSSGEVIFDGQNITNRSTRIAVERGLIHCPQGRELFPQMSVHDNLLMGAFASDGKKRPITDRMQYVQELFPLVVERRSQRAGSLSGGEQQMVAIARALMSRPRLLLLDEPSLGLAPLIVSQLFTLVSRIRDEGTTVLLVEQNARAALGVADRGYVLESGVTVLEDVAASLLANPRLQAAYLGAAGDGAPRRSVGNAVTSTFSQLGE